VLVSRAEQLLFCDARFHFELDSATLVRMSEPSFVQVNCAVLTVSDTRTLETDGSGAVLVEKLGGLGHAIVARTIVPDDLTVIREKLRQWIADPNIDVIISTGGTGITARDVTIEALAPLMTKPIPGFGELFRFLSYEEIGASTIQSRSEGAVCRTTLVFALPGSSGAVRLAMDRILLPQLDVRTRPCNFIELLPRLTGAARG
jgi:molybdenum cofactor biosynthesis protein B